MVPGVASFGSNMAAADRPDCMAISEPPTWTAASASRAAKPSSRPDQHLGRQQPGERQRLARQRRHRAGQGRAEQDAQEQRQQQAQPRQHVVLAEARDDHQRRAEPREDQEHAPWSRPTSRSASMRRAAAARHQAAHAGDAPEQAAGEVAEHGERERQGQELDQQDRHAASARRTACSPGSGSAPAGARSARPRPAPPAGRARRARASPTPPRATGRARLSGVIGVRTVRSASA